MQDWASHASTALVLAHPGHELLLHHFLERHRPLVFVLTDGSGGEGEDRSDFSRRVIEAAGARIGCVFGPAPDRAWYGAILEGDPRPFLAARAAILQACLQAGVERLVCDPIEQFNPMHDLCAILAGSVAHELARTLGREVPVYDYPVEVDWSGQRCDLELTLAPDALARKIAAADAYYPLAAEVEARAGSSSFTVERLRRADPSQSWPAQPDREAFYETFGRRRLAEGVYDRLITYAGHVRPIAMALASSRESGVAHCA